MLIRTTFVSLVLVMALGATADGQSLREPILIPIPTPDPIVEKSQRVELKLLPEESTCAAAYKVEINPTGSLHVVFDGLITDAAQDKFRAYCRLLGTLVVPKGYSLGPSLSLNATVKGALKGGIDNVTGRLRISLGRYAGRDFELTEYAQTDAGAATQVVNMALTTQLPDLPTSCTEDLTWPVSLFVESTINGRASSSIEDLRLDSLNLVPLACNP